MNILKAVLFGGGYPRNCGPGKGFGLTSTPKANARMMNAAGRGELRDPWAISNSLPALFSQGRNACFFIKGTSLLSGNPIFKEKAGPRFSGHSVSLEAHSDLCRAATVLHTLNVQS